MESYSTDITGSPSEYEIRGTRGSYGHSRFEDYRGFLRYRDGIVGLDNVSSRYRVGVSPAWYFRKAG